MIHLLTSTLLPLSPSFSCNCSIPKCDRSRKRNDPSGNYYRIIFRQITWLFSSKNCTHTHTHMHTFNYMIYVSMELLVNPNMGHLLSLSLLSLALIAVVEVLFSPFTLFQKTQRQYYYRVRREKARYSLRCKGNAYTQTEAEYSFVLFQYGFMLC